MHDLQFLKKNDNLILYLFRNCNNNKHDCVRCRVFVLRCKKNVHKMYNRMTLDYVVGSDRVCGDVSNKDCLILRSQPYTVKNLTVIIYLCMKIE